MARQYGPQHGRRESMRRAKADLLLEAARAYAFGAATEKDVLTAAEEYGETCNPAPTDMESR